MHDFGFLVPIAIVAIVFGSRAFRTWVRAKHGYPLEEVRRGRRHSNATSLDDQRQIMLLSNENEKLTGQVSRLEERIAVLERIATDPATRTAAEIEALRDR
ncbi:MAG: hypothetical protein JO221_00575 [Sphingomonas sp.]|uniref:Uncharacterized protein n=1 Tax=Sphingomonas lycopersici TaxID=2951807 RepID=A0AA41Z813_9SPHN|nr:hypothetical protein [Sphingomonas lycopersici]MBV8237239.1 hypothetical protein [Sphingomonas sp.]MCW6529523.1 hypothetical protein [Sphingomonas lycopersici]MCW6534554.1 hypothetical protein [Sphingomonas lycopersici]